MSKSTNKNTNDFFNQNHQFIKWILVLTLVLLIQVIFLLSMVSAKVRVENRNIYNSKKAIELSVKTYKNMSLYSECENLEIEAYSFKKVCEKNKMSDADAKAKRSKSLL